jgi:hypothetical protein
MTTATCSAVATPIARIFAINDDLASRELDGLTHQQLWEAPTKRNNAMLWIAGHLVQTRAQLLRLLGEAFETGWGEEFNRGRRSAIQIAILREMRSNGSCVKSASGYTRSSRRSMTRSWRNRLR